LRDGGEKRKPEESTAEGGRLRITSVRLVFIAAPALRGG